MSPTWQFWLDLFLTFLIAFISAMFAWRVYRNIGLSKSAAGRVVWRVLLWLFAVFTAIALYAAIGSLVTHLVG